MLLVHRVAEDGHRYYLAAVGPSSGAISSPAVAPTVGEAPGRWCGDGAPLLGLRGQVEGVHLARLLAGRHPVEEGPLVVRRVNRVAGLDLLFAAPKSVSITHGLSEPPVAAAVAAAHDGAVDAALGYLERHACVVRQGPARRADGEGIVAAAFRHRTSRADDPHLHTHVVTANLAAGPTGRWSALHTPVLFGEVRTAGALYQATLRHELCALGLEWEVADGTSGRWELAGVGRPVIEAFSRRRQQVALRLAHERERLGAAGPASGAARLTRSPKEGLIDHEALCASWRERAERLDFNTPRPGRAIADISRVDVDEMIVQLGDVFGRADIVRALCCGLARGASAATIEARAEEALRSSSIVALSARRGIGRRDGADGPPARFTSALALQRRRDLLGGPPVQVFVGNRLEWTDAIDGLRTHAEATSRSIVALAPGPAFALDVEAATGVAVAPLARGQGCPHLPPAGSIFVIAGADRVPSVQLADLVERARSGRLDVILAGDAHADRDWPSAFAALASQAAAPNCPVVDGPTGVVTVAASGGTLTVANAARLLRSILVADWTAAVDAGRDAVMVARRPEEVAALVGLAGRPDAAVLAGDAFRHAAREFLVLGQRPPFRRSVGLTHRYVVAAPAHVNSRELVDPTVQAHGPDLRATSLRALDAHWTDARAEPTRQGVIRVHAGLRAAALGLAEQNAPWLVEALGTAAGSVAASPVDRLRRREAAAAVVAYRDRWQVVDRQSALGPEPSTLAQRVDRRRVTEVVASACPQRAAALVVEGPGLSR